MVSFQSTAILAGIVPGVSSLTNSLFERGFDNPAPDNFIRRIFATVAVLGDHVYIDGGEVSQFVDGTGVVDVNTNGMRYPSSPMNTTLSIPLSSSWTNESVTLRSIPKSAPPQNSPMTWIDAAGSSFYEWGGFTFFGTAADNLIWKFTADGQGGGAWSQVTPSNIVAFNNASRPSDAAFTAHGNVGYALGGAIWKRSEATAGNLSAITGLVSFNMDSLRWENASSIGHGQYGTSHSGRMVYAPFGPNGVLMVLGGGEPPVGIIQNRSLVSWDTIGFVDPNTGRWYSQATTGHQPTPRTDFCTVGVQGPQGSYEIFIYGGSDATSSSAVDDMYVLSLPGFVFFKLPNPGTPRAAHVCALVGPSARAVDKQAPRQMLSVGGSAALKQMINSNYSMLDPDPWKQGMGVFDLTEMFWKSQYDADADPYETPRMVRDWYSQGGVDTVSWTDEETKALFISDARKAASSGNDIPGATNSGQGTSLDKPSAASSSAATVPPAMPSSDNATFPENAGEAPSNTASRTGAIVGGIVGGVAGVALLTTLVLLIYRRRARQTKPSQRQRSTWLKPELSSESNKEPQHQRIHQAELDSGHGHSELGPECRHEMPG